MTFSFSEHASTLEALLDHFSEGILVGDDSGNIFYANPASQKILDLPLDRLLGNSFDSVIANAATLWPAEPKGGESETAGLHAVSEWLSVRVPDERAGAVPLEARFARGGTHAGAVLITFLREVSEREILQDQIRDLARRMTTIREEERKRLAGELHDDFAQRLAALVMEFDLVLEHLDAGTSSRKTRASTRGRLLSLRQSIDALLDFVRDWSHRQRPSFDKDPGLATTLHRDCRTIARTRQVSIACSVSCLEDSTPGDVALALYRVAQEALHNAVKHAATRRISLRARRKGTGIALIVRDFGRGFDVEQESVRGGLGLKSMDERVRALGGRMTIRSRLGIGTEIEIWIPLATR